MSLPRVVLGRSFVLALAMLLVFTGGLIFWQQINQPSSNGCYTFPAGTLSLFFFMQPYSGTCPFNSLPGYYASDVALTLVVFGFLLALVRVRRNKIMVGGGE